MSPVRHEGDQRVPVSDWGSHVDKMIREAQARGVFDNLPGTGKPLNLDDENPYNVEWVSAFRLVKNAGAAPLWIELDKEIRQETAALEALLERTEVYLQTCAAQIDSRTLALASDPPAPRTGRWRQRWRSFWFRLWPRKTPAATPDGRDLARTAAHVPPNQSPPLLAEAERRRARARYLAGAAKLDSKIQEYNTHRPRNLVWLEKPRLLPQMAAARFDSRCPPLASPSPVLA